MLLLKHNVRDRFCKTTYNVMEPGKRGFETPCKPSHLLRCSAHFASKFEETPCNNVISPHSLRCNTHCLLPLSLTEARLIVSAERRNSPTSLFQAYYAMNYKHILIYYDACHENPRSPSLLQCHTWLPQNYGVNLPAYIISPA